MECEFGVITEVVPKSAPDAPVRQRAARVGEFWVARIGWGTDAHVGIVQVAAEADAEFDPVYYLVGPTVPVYHLEGSTLVVLQERYNEYRLGIKPEWRGLQQELLDLEKEGHARLATGDKRRPDEPEHDHGNGPSDGGGGSSGTRPASPHTHVGHCCN